MKRAWSVALLVVMGMAACGDAERDASVERSGVPSDMSVDASTVVSSTSTAPSVEELFALTERTLRSGGVYHLSGSFVGDGVVNLDHRVDVWADATRDAVRIESMSDQQARPSVAITVDGVHWIAPLPRRGLTTSLAVPTRPWSCAGAGHAASVVLGCPTPDVLVAMSVETATHEGRPAWVLVTTGESNGSDSRSKFMRRLIVDPASGLPLAMSETGEQLLDRVVPISAEAVYSGEFLDSDTLRPDLFDLAALGWGTHPQIELSTDVPVYWLGPWFDPGEGLTPLLLSSVAPGGDSGPGYEGMLTYAMNTPDRSGPGVIVIQLWTRAKFEASGFRREPCLDEPPFAVAVGVATFQCSDADDPSVLVDADDDSVLVISAPLFMDAGTPSNPFRNRDAMTLVVQGLRLRVR